MIDLAKIGLRFSALSGNMYLCRFGKKPDISLDKRVIEKEIMACITEMMMHDSPKGAFKTYRFGDKKYKLTVQPVI